jgi:hypothetical protein
MVPYITVAESTLPSHTVTFVTLVGAGFSMGELVLSLEAYLFRDWQTLTVNPFEPNSECFFVSA